MRTKRYKTLRKNMLKNEKDRKNMNKFDRTEISLCPSCYSATHTIKDKQEARRCSKCGGKKK